MAAVLGKLNLERKDGQASVNTAAIASGAAIDFS
jgi:hypothetical protein